MGRFIIREAAIALIGLCAGCDALFNLDHVERRDAGGSAGDHVRRITITQSSDEQLVDFPVSIVLTADPDLAQAARPDGTDISFEMPGGAPLPFELVAYNSGSLEAWVRVTLGRTTDIVMRYGGAPVVSDPTQAWSDRFEAAWHLAEPTGGAKDSTRHDHDLSPVQAALPPAITGVVGAARTFAEPAVDPREGLCAAAGDVIGFEQMAFSFGTWMRAAGQQLGTYDQAFDAGGVTNGTAGFSIELQAAEFMAQLADSGTAYTQISFETGTRGAWLHLVVVVDRKAGVAKTYVNGLAAGMGPITGLTGTIFNERPLCLAGNDGYTGDLDEPRVYHDVLSPAWIDAEYDNVASRSDFVRVAPPE